LSLKRVGGDKALFDFNSNLSLPPERKTRSRTALEDDGLNPPTAKRQKLDATVKLEPTPTEPTVKHEPPQFHTPPDAKIEQTRIESAETERIVQTDELDQPKPAAAAAVKSRLAQLPLGRSSYLSVLSQSCLFLQVWKKLSRTAK